MRRLSYVFYTFLYLLFASSLCAQTFSAKTIIGINFSQLDGDRLKGFNKRGLNIGIGADARLSSRWSVGTEFLYSVQGALVNPDRDTWSPYRNIHLQFVEVPILFNFSDRNLQFSSGFAVNRLASFKVIDFTGVDVTESETYTNNALSLVFSGAWFFSDHLALNIRFSKFLNNLRKPSDLDSSPFSGRNIALRIIYII